MLDEVKSYYLQQMGIQAWEVSRLRLGDRELAKLSEEIAQCPTCAASKTLLGRGEPTSRLMIVADSPDFSEILLHNMLRSIGLQEGDVYVSYLGSCSNHLQKQIKSISPEVLLILGKIALNSLAIEVQKTSLRESSPIIYHDIPCVATFHPDHLLKSPLDKKQAYQDLLSLKAVL